MALRVEDIEEGEAEATTAVVAGVAEAAGAAAAAVEDTMATTRVEEHGAVPAASESTMMCQDQAPSPIL